MADDQVVVVAVAGSARERAAIEAWARGAYPDADVVACRGDELVLRLARDDDPVIVPVGVAAFAERVPVIVGEPARESVLRRQWLVETGAAPGSGLFARYVAREAARALERIAVGAQ